MEPAVVCRNLKKHYGKGATRVDALKGIDLDVYPGELLMIVGPSGSGKTTLLSIIGGVMRRDSGDCTIFEYDFAKLSHHRRAAVRRTEIGFLFQSFNLIPTLTLAENVAIPLLLSKMNRRKALSVAAEKLAEVGLGDRTQAHPNEISGGEQQRVAICRAIIHEPRLVVCDEPTSAIDAKTGLTVMDMLVEIAHRPDRALIVVTHDPRIFSYADRIVEMADGMIGEEGS